MNEVDELNNAIKGLDISSTADTSNSGVFNFKYSNEELDKIIYNQICKELAVNRFADWVLNNQWHTFPKTEKKWLNTFQTQRNLRKYIKRYDTKEVLRDIILKKYVPFYLEDMHNRINEELNINKIILSNENIDIVAEKLKKSSYIIVYISVYDLYNFLFECGKLYKSGRKVRKTNIIIINTPIKKKRSRNEIESDLNDLERKDKRGRF